MASFLAWLNLFTAIAVGIIFVAVAVLIFTHRHQAEDLVRDVTTIDRTISSLEVQPNTTFILRKANSSVQLTASDPLEGATFLIKNLSGKEIELTGNGLTLIGETSNISILNNWVQKYVFLPKNQVRLISSCTPE